MYKQPRFAHLRKHAIISMHITVIEASVVSEINPIIQFVAADEQRDQSDCSITQ